MPGTWNLIRRALIEASEKDALLAHIKSVYGDKEHDALAPFLDSMWDSGQLKDVARVLTKRYSGDKNVDDILGKALQKSGQADDGAPQGPTASVMKRNSGDGSKTPLATVEPTVGKRGRGRPPGSKNKANQGPGPSKFADPEQVKAQQAATAATAGMRPDRAKTTMNMPGRPQVAAVPGERPTHDVGTAGQSPGSMPGHTRPPQVQTSQEVVPSTTGKDLESLRARQKDLKRQVAGLTGQKDSNPGDKSIDRKLVTISTQLQDVEQQIARVSSAGKSGIEDSQKRVDYITQTYGAAQGDALAAKLGVPSTKQRTRKVRDQETGQPVKDPKTGEDKTVVQVWNAEKVAKFQNKEPELPVGAYDLPGKPSMPGPEAGAERGPKAPLRKPMRKNPETGASEMRPGDFAGQRWKPSGVSQKKVQHRADQATGNFAQASRFTNPAEEGQEVVWDGSDWILPSQYAAKKGETNASRDQADGTRRKWMSGAQSVKGNPLSTSADREKAMAAQASGKKPPDVQSKHRQTQKAIDKAFDGDD